jgi:hypothetical protein
MKDDAEQRRTDLLCNGHTVPVQRVLRVTPPRQLRGDHGRPPEPTRRPGRTPNRRATKAARRTSNVDSTRVNPGTGDPARGEGGGVLLWMVGAQYYTFWER